MIALRCAAVCVALMASLVGCEGAPDNVLGGDCARGEEITTDSELAYVDLDCGDGAEASHGDALTVRYMATLSNGEVFDSTATGESLEFLFDSGNVISGWSEGIDGMREGGRRRIVIPPELGYGERGLAGLIPQNETLTYVVELIEVRKPD